ncbi:reverse transcriptase domain-containing protein [Tanacetum coccineum]
MRTRNSYFPNNSNVTIPRRRNKGRAPNIVEPELRTIVAPMAEHTMEELLRAPTEGYGEAIVLPEINVDHFEIKTNLLQLVQANPFYGRESENPHAHINSFKRITSTLRFRNVLTIEAWERFKELLRACPHHGFTELTQVDTFYNGLNENEQDSLNAAAGGNLLSKTTREALNIIENKSKVRYSRNRSNASRMNATSSKTDERIDKLADQLSTLVEIVSKKVVTPAPVKAVEETCVTCGGAHSWYNCPATDNNQASVCATTGTYNQVNPPNRVSNQMAPPGFAPVQNNGQNRFNQNQVQGNNFWGNNFHGNQEQGSTAQIPPPVIPVSILEPAVPKSLPKTTPIMESDISKSLPKPNIPYPSRRDDQKSRDKASNQMEKIFQIFQDLRFDISFADALLLMPRFAPTIKSLLMNKEKLLELAKIRMDVCHALADLGASINLMPLSIWKKLSLPDLTPTRMTLELADRSITYPKGLAEDVFCQSWEISFSYRFVVVDFKADPRVLYTLGDHFGESCALFDVYGDEITLRVDNEAVHF